MNFPDFSEEKKLQQEGYKMVVGLDEAGRGPLAGPVVAAAVVVLDYDNLSIKGINDSKKISAKKREEIYQQVIYHPSVKWGVGVVSEKVIDKINILQATKLAMKKSLQPHTKVDFLLLDGNFKIDSKIPQKSIIEGDGKVISIALAGIIAKVTRDRMMQEYHKKYPQYGFDKHKGYGTAFHVANLKKFGASKIHRKTFYPVGTL